jgi:AraC-like DNA-binding protein
MISVRTAYPQRIYQLVKSFWYLEVTPADAGSYEEEIVPDGHHEIIFHISAEPGRVKLANAAEWVAEPHALVVGQTLQKHHLRLSPGARLYGIRFFPHTLLAFLDLPVAGLTGRFYALDTVTDARPFWDCITDDPDRTFLNFETLLARKLRYGAIQNSSYDYVNAAILSIMNNKGEVTGAELTRKTGISKAHLDNLFFKYVGITPKLFSRIIQLNSFIAYRTKHPDKSLTQCCYQAGYYDQSHLAKAFHSFIGRSPRSYFGHDNEINGIFSSL